MENETDSSVNQTKRIFIFVMKRKTSHIRRSESSFAATKLCPLFIYRKSDFTSFARSQKDFGAQIFQI